MIQTKVKIIIGKALKLDDIKTKHKGFKLSFEFQEVFAKIGEVQLDIDWYYHGKQN